MAIGVPALAVLVLAFFPIVAAIVIAIVVVRRRSGEER